MTRSLQIPGATLLSVKGGSHLSGLPVGVLTELGLAVDSVRVAPQFSYDDTLVDGFGPYVPADVQWKLGTVEISCKLIQFDVDVLDTIVNESMGKGTGNATGKMAPTGSFLGGRKEMYSSGCHFFSLTLYTDAMVFGSGFPWRFRRCHLWQRPIIQPVGVDAQQVEVTFRALPYADPYRSGLYSGVSYGLNPVTAGLAIERDGILFVRNREILGSGAILWDFTADRSG